MYLLMRSSNLLIKKNTNRPSMLPFNSYRSVFWPLYNIIRSKNGINIIAVIHNIVKVLNENPESLKSWYTKHIAAVNKVAFVHGSP